MIAYYTIQLAIYFALSFVLNMKGIGIKSWQFYFIAFCIAASQANIKILGGE